MINPTELKEAFINLGKFAIKNKIEIFEIYYYEGDWVKEMEYVSANLDYFHFDSSPMIELEYYHSNHDSYRFEIPLEYINSPEQWLEDLKKEENE